LKKLIRFHPGHSAAAGHLSLEGTQDLGILKDRTRERAAFAWKVRNWLARRWKQDLQLFVARKIGRILSLVVIESRLYLKVLHADGTVTDLGLVGRRLVTNVGVGYIVDAFQNLVELENMKFHGFGTGDNAESASDTALETELTTQYVSNVRPTGTTAEGASANIYRSVATLSPDAGGTIAVGEHGLFSADAAGVLFDRTVFSPVNLVATQDSLQATYEVTFSSGG